MFWMSEIQGFKLYHMHNSFKPFSFNRQHNNIRDFVRCGRRPLGVEVQ